MRTISHDPFARQSLVRENVEALNGHTCSWCGQVRTENRGAHGVLTRTKFLYRYGIERDDRGGVNWHRGTFCCKPCHDAYHS